MFLDDAIEIGQIKYKVFGEIGAGSCGKVYVVQCPQNKKYALKVISYYGRDERIKCLIDNEIVTQSKFSQNPFIIHIYGHMQRYKKMYILFELGEQSLRKRIDWKTHIELTQFLKICIDTSQALYSIHAQKIIHRDIKPENIICVDGNYKITDFGSSNIQTLGDDFIGTTLYMAPQVLNAEIYSIKADVWSLGVSLFETYFHIHPFFYLQGEDLDPKTVENHLKENMKYLLPDFSIEKFLILINAKAPRQKVIKASEILQVTPPALVQQFPIFFSNKHDRQHIDYFVAKFTQLSKMVQKLKPKQVKLKVKKEQLPSQIRFYIDTLELFYLLSFKYGSSMFLQVQLRFQLCIFYWSNFTYKNYFKFMEYYQQASIKSNLKDRATLWIQIKKVLFDYWCELSSNKDLEFFQDLQILKLRILICGARFNLVTSPDQQITFCSKVYSIIKMQINSLNQLQQYFKVIEVRQILEIEEYVTSRYYLK